jgi:predicted amidophosphoribosyltransferase
MGNGEQNECPECGRNFPPEYNYCPVCSTDGGHPVELPMFNTQDRINTEELVAKREGRGVFAGGDR